MANPENLNEDEQDYIGNAPLISTWIKLPMLDFVRFTTESTQMLSILLSLPAIVFDSYIERTPSHDIERIIYRILLHHEGTINTFILELQADTSHADIDHWVHHLSSKHQIHRFDLDIMSGDRYKTTSHFYKFQDISHLNLSGCQLTPPPQFQGFSRLVWLHLVDVPFFPGRFISQCPLLQWVHLKGCAARDPLEVEGPSLRIFAFHGFATSIHFKRCPVLDRVTVCTPSPIFGHLRFSPCKCLNFIDTESLVPLKDRHLYTRLLEFSSAGNLFPRLKVLDISMHLASIQQLDRALLFIRHSPKLETLIVRLWTSKPVEAVTDFIRAQERPNHDLNQLKRIKLRCYLGEEPEKELAGYLLESAAALDEMVIEKAFYSVFYGRFEDLEADMRKYRWASPTARLTVSNPSLQP